MSFLQTSRRAEDKTWGREGSEIRSAFDAVKWHCPALQCQWLAVVSDAGRHDAPAPSDATYKVGRGRPRRIQAPLRS